MTSPQDVQNVAEQCRACLDWSVPPEESGYAKHSCLPTCVLEAVFSINARYAAARNVVDRYGNYAQLRDDREESISEFISTMSRFGCERFAEEILRNTQRTSTRSGILKAEAALRFAKVLAEFGVQYLADAGRILHSSSFSARIHQIPGQRRSLDYFLMLAGRDDLVKADRMILRFLERALGGARVSASSALDLLREATLVLRKDHPRLTPRQLDWLIWKHETGWAS